MSVNDPDGEPYPILSKEEFMRRLMATGWIREAAEKEWERISDERHPYAVRSCDLEW